MRIDYHAIAQQQEAQMQMLQIVKENPELLDKLKQASKDFGGKVPVQVSKKD